MLFLGTLSGLFRQQYIVYLFYILLAKQDESPFGLEKKNDLGSSTHRDLSCKGGKVLLNKALIYDLFQCFEIYSTLLGSIMKTQNFSIYTDDTVFSFTCCSNLKTPIISVCILPVPVGLDKGATLSLQTCEDRAPCKLTQQT